MTVVRSIRAVAPVRVCDVGGWTDTWFGSPGQVCSVAVGPGIEVIADLFRLGPGVHHRPPVVHLVAPDLGADYRFDPAAVVNPRHPLLEHCVADATAGRIETLTATGSGHDLRVTIRSGVPAGASLGTSASVMVAVLAALDRLLNSPADDSGGDADRELASPVTELARRAHGIETGPAGRQAGVQDHWAAALGGFQHLVVDTYPEVRARPLTIAEAVSAELGDRLVTVVFGPHDSSEVHNEVIHALLSCDGDGHHRVRQATRKLSSLAAQAATALETGDLDSWADVLTRSTVTQAELHSRLVGPAHTAAIDAARSLGASGWKVNGAGGNGGSLTVVAGTGPQAASPAEIRSHLTTIDPNWTTPDLQPSPGVTVQLHPESPAMHGEDLVRRGRTRPSIDLRSSDAIIGYDDDGLPT
ncbi:MAG: hypothetical protein IPG97_19200 [Microthrixaceae bacterium]|jgi:D-glycero-alpha-D-manno-heptose-7-phosphate kinase|nr:hypothetical protein [Microthrixaceae bacterium]